MSGEARMRGGVSEGGRREAGGALIGIWVCLANIRQTHTTSKGVRGL
jgi:hypothetical protein